MKFVSTANTNKKIARKLALDFSSGCWLWLGAISKKGYATLNTGGGRTPLVHKFLYEQKFGCVPAGLELDHLCRVRCCVNPFHLEPVTHAENMRRGSQATATHCKRGHEFSPENTRIGINGQRFCRECLRKNAREAAQNQQEIHRHSKLFCKRGHRLFGDNLYLETTERGKIKRRCRECNRLKEQNRSRRRSR